MAIAQHAAPVTHRLSVQGGSPGWGQPLKPGRLVALQVKRFEVNKAAGQVKGKEKHGAVISVTGIPGSKSSKAYKASITFMLANTELPSPSFDHAEGCIHLYYPYEEMQAVLGVLNSKRDRLCYFWQTTDGSRSLAWLLAVA